LKLVNLGPFTFARLGANALRDLAKGLDHYTQSRLWLKILVSLVLGCIAGYLLGPDFHWISPKTARVVTSWMALPGQLFLSMIKLVVIPLVFASVVLGIIGSESIQKLKSLGLKIGVYYIFTTVCAVGFGFIAAYLIRPGNYINSEMLSNLDSGGSPPASLPISTGGKVDEFIGGLIPSNPFIVLVNGQMLQVVLLAIFLGIALMSLSDEEANPLISLLNTFQKIAMVVISWAMRLAPIAVFGLTARIISQLGTNALFGLGIYVVTVLAGLVALMAFYLILIKVVARESILDFMRNIREVQLLAFSTSSSASVMPLTIETAEKKLNVRPSISQFIIPLGTTINMDGTALYQGVATVFLAQVFKVDLSFSQITLVVVTATLSSIGAPGTPGVGIAVLSTILSSVGIPTSGVLLILGVDRLLDMCRTVLNVTGDLTAAVVMNKLLKNEN